MTRPGAGGSPDQPGSATKMPPGREERARTLSLIDFLADYDARPGRRLPGYRSFLERMRALYRDQSVAVPDALQAVASCDPSALAGPVPAPHGGRHAIAEPLLLPLPADEAQQRVLELAQHSSGVTVQGPAGAVTSNTIGNIISHHVAYGKRVLVVAGKAEALRALTGMIPPGIKELAISVLGPDAEGRPESATGQIQARVAAFDQALADERIRRLNADLDGASQSVSAAAQELRAAREAEVERLPGQWLAGETPTRAEAALWVAVQRSRLDYIDDVITPATARPVTAGELGEFLRLIHDVGVSRADANARELPELAAIPFAAELEERFAKRSRLEASVRSLGDAVFDWALAVGCGREGLQAFAARCQAEGEWMTKNAGTWLGHVQIQAGDPPLARDWRSFCAQLSADRQEALRLRGLLTPYRVVVPDVIEPSLVEGLQQAKDRLSEFGKLGLFAGQAKRAVQECQVDGRQVVTVADIDVCLQKAALETLRGRMRTSWQNQLARVGGAELEASVPEDALGPLLEDLGRALSWPRAWAQLRAELAAVGISSPPEADVDILGRLADVCVQACDQIAAQELSRRFRSLDEWLQDGARSAAASPLWDLFVAALAAQDLAEWRRLREELKDLQQIGPQARWLRELRGRLSAVAPIWTARILADPDVAGDPADFDAAWQWRQLDCWVRQPSAGPTPAQLHARLEELSLQRRRITAELVSECAWRHLADDLADPQRPVTPEHAVPVWIMPAARALTSFGPEADPPFDVLVAAEASQIGLEALPLLALAGKVIVVGDGRQATRDDAGLDRDQVLSLLDEHLAGTPGNRTLFDPGLSLYGVAVRTFPGVVTLTGPAEAADPAQPAPDSSPAGPALLQYQAWTPRALPRPDTAPLAEVIAGLREIVDAEGPIHTQRAYQLYTRAAGARRVGSEMRRAFHEATRQALSEGAIRQLDDETVGLDDKTLYAPGKPTVLVRELGPRQIPDVPRSEVAKLIRYLRLDGAAEDVVKRAVLSAYGVARLTTRTSRYLDECLSYRTRRA